MNLLASRPTRIGRLSPVPNLPFHRCLAPNSSPGFAFAEVVP